MNYYLVNESTRVSSHEADVIAKAVAGQLSEAAFKHGRLSTPLTFLDDPKHLVKQVKSHVAFAIRDHLENGEYGRDEKNGMKVVYAFTDGAAKPLTGPLSIASRVSKQVLGFFGNPEFTAWVKTGPSFMPFELCSPCDDLTYDVVVSDINGVAQLVTLADYVFPSWFENLSAGPYDRSKKLTHSLGHSEGGFLPFFEGERCGSEGKYDPLNFRHWHYSRITQH